MTDSELEQAFSELRPLVTSVLGFQALAEDETIELSDERRHKYTAHVTANGIELAKRVWMIADELSQREAAGLG